jgi:hypothetical protein
MVRTIKIDKQQRSSDFISFFLINITNRVPSWESGIKKEPDQLIRLWKRVL